MPSPILSPHQSPTLPEEPDIEPNQFQPTYIILALLGLAVVIFALLVFFTDLL